MRILAALLKIGWASDARAAPKTTIIDPPTCQNNSIEKVEFTSSSPARHNFAAGMARRDSDGMPVVYRLNYELAPTELQGFMDFHQCAHHQVGDVDQTILQIIAQSTL